MTTKKKTSNTKKPKTEMHTYLLVDSRNIGDLVRISIKPGDMDSLEKEIGMAIDESLDSYDKCYKIVEEYDVIELETVTRVSLSKVSK